MNNLLNKVKREYAKEKGFSSFKQLIARVPVGTIHNHYDIVAIKYGEAVSSVRLVKQ